MKTLNDLKNVAGKIVLLRLDLNVPIDADKNVTDTTRIDRVKETVLRLSSMGARVAILSHFGRPKGQKNMDYSLSFLPEILEKQWGMPVGFCEDCTNSPDFKKDGEVVLMENVRFYDGEESCAPDFVAKIAGGVGDVFVNDAFSASHRAHASTEGLAHALPSYAGLALQAELEALEKALGQPERPVMAIVGGAKISTKLAVLNHLIDKVDILVLGGGMANTFLYAAGCDMGQSLCEKDMKDQALEILAKAEEGGCSIFFPIDGKAAKEFKADANYDDVSVTVVPTDSMILDMGPQSIQSVCGLIDQCETLIWNGPVGAFEIQPFDDGTVTIAKHVATQVKQGELIAIAGGGDTVAALSIAGVMDDMTYVSTAGGAFLEWMEGKDLPAISALEIIDEAE